MTESIIQQRLEELRDVLYAEGGRSVRADRGRIPGVVHAWLNLPDLVELAVKYGVSRNVVDVPRGVFQTRDQKVHWRSDTPCAARSTYQKLYLKEKDLLCPECAHVHIEGRTGFQTQALLQLLAVLARSHQILERLEEREVVKLGIEIDDVQRELEELGRQVDQAVVRSPRSTPEIEKLTKNIRGRILNLRADIEAAYTSPEFRKEYELQLSQYETAEGAASKVITSSAPHMMVVLENTWQVWIQLAMKIYPILGAAQNRSSVAILQVPGEAAWQLRALFSREVLENPIPMPDEPAVVETAVALYDPTGGSKLSTLENAVKAAELV